MIHEKRKSRGRTGFRKNIGDMNNRTGGGGAAEVLAKDAYRGVTGNNIGNIRSEILKGLEWQVY